MRLTAANKFGYDTLRFRLARLGFFAMVNPKGRINEDTIR